MAETKEASRPSHELQHIRIERFRSEKDFRAPNRMLEQRLVRDRGLHGPRLLADLAKAFADARDRLAARDPELETGAAGVYLAIESAERTKLPDLTWSSKDIRLGALKVNENGTEAGTLFVPTTAESFLASKIEEYTYQTTPKNKPKHEAKFAPVETIRAGSLESLWTDKRALPTNSDDRIWWECWCWLHLAAHLYQAARRLNLRTSERQLSFPELKVIPVYASRAEINRLLQNTDAIEELRRATDTPTFFLTTARQDQNLWVGNLVDRVEAAADDSPAVCILDSGVARAHPLLAPSLDPADCLTVDSSWGVDDHDSGGHGTNMAGTVLYADLTYPLSDHRAIKLDFQLESVKLLPPPGFPQAEPASYGAITQAAISRPEIENPERSRAFCMAVTNEDLSGERPTSWSAAIDQICAGTMTGDEPDENGELPRRLFFVSAGNVPDASDPDDVADPDEFPVEDPAQAWNAISVGGFTDKVDIDLADDLAGWTALAEAGDRSPYSRTSTDWEQSRSPMKPEIVFEAGNRAISPSGRELVSGVESLSLLTTSRDFLDQPLTTFWATSPATAQAAGMAGTIMARNPDLWPETIRALMVHSADWTPSMREQLRRCNGRKKECVELARRFGYGVPRLERALASAQNDLALVAQTHIQPFRRQQTLDAQGRHVFRFSNKAHYYQLPWPQQSLWDLADKNVRLKVTLSYFIEPSPGQAAPVTPARYQSYGLRYELKRSSETEAAFRQRINQLERGQEKLPKVDLDSRWTFGRQSIAAGSLHCDVWVGPAAELASRNVIAVYPVGGWWRYRPQLKKYNSQARYGLVISIASDDEDVELYAEIANLVGISVESEIGS